MSNVLCIAWRTPCSGVVPSSLLPFKSATFRSIFCDLRTSFTCRSYSTFRPRPTLDQRLHSVPFLIANRFGQTHSPTSIRSFSTSVALLSQSAPPAEHGVPPRAEPFSQAEINKIFGPRAKISSAMGNRVLAVLHGRRVDGTLDLDLPKDIIRSVPPSSRDAALEWLRENYPLDEDAAILARIEREELEEQQKLIRRAEELGLYKPQSGTFGAERGEADDPYGKSVLKEIRERNEARLLAEQERKRKEWLENENKEREQLLRQVQQNTALQKFDDSSALEVRERADPAQRPLLAWIQKHHLQATEWNMEAAEKLSKADRILPSLALTLLVFGLSYAFAANYEAPARADRMWPDMPPAAATVFAIMGANLAIFLLWKFPPAWRTLNRYFINVAFKPHPLSIVGNVFSHQQFKHLAMNMLMLWFIGTKLHDDIGRGNFLGLYMAAGAFGSMMSLTAHVLMGQLMITSLGASGAISGIVAAWCLLHSQERFTIFFLPAEWQEVISAKGWVLLTGFVAFEILNVVSPLRVVKLDHFAHLGGYLIGAVWALMWKGEQEKKRRKNRTWFDRFLSE
ncbi:hypothetical protein CDV55_106872 [Aspergillus turcosus]|uniref:Peptidase S54 rhomboid domain-containing protein n=1 Tax=Aspergillus turcosus TaxID=1245748 RepID=A0A229XBA4_9EURO|nr:hypothetical protein CDV55_106872 [Aspergillus turcosus]RLM01073.1 hypothetical protein CFD26_105726 [Aspergillus turcosus]